MKLLTRALLIVLSLSSLVAHGQAHLSRLAVDASAGFTAIHANEGPGQCGCFYLYGGNGEFALKNDHHISFIVDFGRTTQTNINADNQNLTLYTVQEGARYTLNQHGRFAPFGEGMVGFVHTTSNYVIYKDTTRAAAAFGGGLDINLAPRISLRPVEVDYLLTTSPNGQNNQQNEVRYSAGVVFHIRHSTP